MILPAYHSVFTALHENSRAFEQYLASENFQAALDEANLRRKPKHTILAHVRLLLSSTYSELFSLNEIFIQRLYAPLEAPWSTLPVFQDQESWYLRVRLVFNI
jgi:hypothetical protein